MKGKTGNFIITLREGEALKVDGPAKFMIKSVKGNRTTLLINANDETKIERESKEVTEGPKGAKESSIEGGRRNGADSK